MLYIKFLVITVMLCKYVAVLFSFIFVWNVMRDPFDLAVTLESTEAFCTDPGCMKYFTNKQCLKAHIQSCHRHINCEFCGTMQLKKNIKRHLRTHEVKPPSGRMKCSVKDCLYTFSCVRLLTMRE